MSRLTSMSPDALKAIFSPESDQELIILLTIYINGTDEATAVRLADGFTKRISETESEVIYGVTSNGKDYTFLPLTITLPSEDASQAPRCSITLYDVTRYITPIIRTITSPPRVKMELVLSSSPDVIEVSFSEFYISNFTYNANAVQAELSMIDYSREPFPMHSFTPKYFPGLF